MMAGAGVGGVGGVGMLRTRRRDVSVKPNRKLDRKSSRGMIYENEELRLRTIHINAEVEQGQNDIKKLRRENEQLRREIWSLRDEYDKLEEILKRQKSHDESEEDRSEEDDGPQSDSSCEEDAEECVGNNEKRSGDLNQEEEQLENAENQKISSEKMSSGLHRLRVEFDDLSVVDEEEEELKRDKGRKEATSSSEEGRKNETGRQPPPPPILGPRQRLHDNIPFYPAAYERPTSGFTSGTSYYTECPYEFPSTVDLMLPTDTSALLASPCPAGLQPDPLIPLHGTGLDAVGLDQLADPMLPEIHVPPVGWQSDVLSQDRLPAYVASSTASSSTTTTGMQMIPPSENSTSLDTFSCTRRRNARQATRLLEDASAFQDSRTRLLSTEEATIERNARGGILTDSTSGRNATKTINDDDDDDGKQESSARVESVENISAPEKPKRFFAPLSFKLKKQEEESPSRFGTGTSSSSGKTASTVISRTTNPFCLGQKGSADIYVNGAIPCDEEEEEEEERNGSKTSLSAHNLLVTDSRGASNGQLTKSVSCQNLSSECQRATGRRLKLNHIESQQMFARSDNNLDGITADGCAGKPYKSHLNVTLRIPRVEQAPSPETPEIPNLPTIDYRLFRNPFLRNLDKICCPNYQAEPNPPPAATPLCVQVNDDDDDDDDDGYRYPVPTYGRGDVHRNEKQARAAHLSDQNRLLIASDQLMGDKHDDIQVTSFEKPSPCTLIPSATASRDLATLGRSNANRYLQSQNLCRKVSFVPRGPGQFHPQKCTGMMYYDYVTKVTAQTQTSIDGDSHHEDETRQNAEGAVNSLGGQKRRRKIARKDKILMKDEGALSPTAQRRLKKQSSAATSADALDNSPTKVKPSRKQSRKLSTAIVISDAREDRNESRSSSSGQDSPRKDRVAANRRVSVCINSKRRASQASLKSCPRRSGSVDPTKDKCTDGAAANSERERTNSVSSREIASVKARKTSTSSAGNVPWCACWGNGCI